MATSLVAVVILAVVGLYLQGRLGRNESIRFSRESAVLVGRGIIGPLLTDAALDGDPAALAQLDRVVRGHVLDDEIVRVKVRQRDGLVVYSDRAELIGQRLPLDASEVAAFESETGAGVVTDLRDPENVSEREFGTVLEVDVGVDTPGGRRVIVDSFERSTGVFAGGRRLWLAFAPILLGVIILLWLTQGPLTWRMARQLRRGQEDRERLLVRAVEASDVERRRIAADLHDGVVQRLAGTAYSLAAAVERLPSASKDETKGMLDEAVVGVRRVMQELRSLIVEIHPPTLEQAGLEAALNDLVAPLAARGIASEVHVDDGVHPTSQVEKLVFRGAQEAVRNVIAHARAETVAIAVTKEEDVVRLVVVDDGRGIDEQQRASKEHDGHVGLTLLAELAAEMRGTLTVATRVEGGTRLTLEVPER
jgi:two-component system NarL family sensor kinase